MVVPLLPAERRFHSLLWRSLLLPVILLLLVALLLSWASGRLLRNVEQVRTSDETISQAIQLLKLGVDMETGIRGYQLVGDRRLLEPYEAARDAMPGDFAALDRLISAPDERALLDAARGAHAEWAKLGEELIARREVGQDYQGTEINLRGKQLFDAFRAQVAAFIAREEILRRDRARQFEVTSERVLRGRMIALLALGLGLGWYTRRQLHEVAGMFRAAEESVRREAEKARQSADALRAARDQLEIRVAERTRELQAALTKAQEVDRLKSEFLATMSHELRTPLNSIIGFSEIVLAGIPGPLNEEQKKQLQFVHGSANHLLQLINDLLDLARIESGRVEPAWEQVSPARVIQEAIDTIRPLAVRKGLELHRTVDLPERFRTDRKMFFQVLLNLLGNAVKFTGRGEVRLVARTVDGGVEVSIRDTGIGIKPEQMALLFEAFRQVDGSVQRRYQGTGLGLYLCKRTVELLGGTITAASEFGRGSTFTFMLPAQP